MTVPSSESRLPESWEPELRRALDPDAASVRRVTLTALAPGRRPERRHRLLLVVATAAVVGVVGVAGVVLLDSARSAVAKQPLIANVGRVVATRDPAGHITLRLGGERPEGPSRAYILLKGEPR